jgi:tetratricopeptide (TPR) repeat protein
MRSAEIVMRLAAGLTMLAMTGCATVTSMLPSDLGGATASASAPPVTPAPAASTPAAKNAGSSVATPAKLLEATVAVDPAAQKSFEAARQALAAGRRDEAERGFVALTTSHPDLGGPHASLGLLYLQANQPAAAVAALERAVKASPRQAQYFDQLGIAYRHVGQFDKARAAYEQAIEADPTYAPAQLNLGVLYDLYLWDAPRALEHYDRYLALTTDNDDKVKRWVVELRKRTAPKSQPNLASRDGGKPQ